MYTLVSCVNRVPCRNKDRARDAKAASLIRECPPNEFAAGSPHRSHRSTNTHHCSQEAISHDAYRFRFKLPSAEHTLGLPVGKHVSLKFKDAEGKDVIRQYTPITSDEVKGYFDLVIKIYREGKMGPGKMGTHLEAMEIGQTIDIRGPSGKLAYEGAGRFTIKRGRNEVQDVTVKRVGLIAGGTGLTPMLQVARAVMDDASDNTELVMIFANQTEEDILLRKELEERAARHHNFKIVFTLDRPTDSWKGESGFVSAQMIDKHMFKPSADSLILFCGPPGMCGAMVKNMEALDFSKTQYFQY